MSRTTLQAAGAGRPRRGCGYRLRAPRDDLDRVVGHDPVADADGDPDVRPASRPVEVAPNAVFTRTPPSMLTGSTPKPTPPSRSSRSSITQAGRARRPRGRGGGTGRPRPRRVHANTQALKRAGEQRPQRVGAPALRRRRSWPSRRSPRRTQNDAAMHPLWDEQPPDHPRARRLDGAAQRMSRGPCRSPGVRRDEGAAVSERVGRPRAPSAWPSSGPASRTTTSASLSAASLPRRRRRPCLHRGRRRRRAVPPPVSRLRPRPYDGGAGRVHRRARATSAGMGRVAAGGTVWLGGARRLHRQPRRVGDPAQEGRSPTSTA